MRHGARALAATIALVAGTLATAVPAHAAGTGGAPGGTFTATCVLGPLSQTRTFTAVGHAPDSVAPGAGFDVVTSVDYPVFADATAGFANFHAVGASLPEPRIFVPGGADAIGGALDLTATAPAGSAAEVVLDDFGAGKIVGGASAAEICRPDHTLVVARVGIGVPLVSVGDAAVVEGSSGTRALAFAVTLSRPAATAVTVAWETEDGTANATSDYVGASGTVTIPAGANSGSATVRVRGDAVVEPKENFRIRLHDATGAVLDRSLGTGRIIDDDPEPGRRVSVGDATVVEGAQGSRSARFTVSLSTAASVPVSVLATTVAGSAHGISDFRAQDVALTFAPGEMSKTVAVQIVADDLPEAAESFAMHLSGAQGVEVGRHDGVGSIIDDD